MHVFPYVVDTSKYAKKVNLKSQLGKNQIEK